MRMNRMVIDMFLNKDISSARIKDMTVKDLNQLSAEIRRFLIKTVSQNGGHLASNLGTVELTVALHKVFDSPSDKFIFDVGHQSYTHKLLTGRFERFATLRSEGGISGFPRQSESQHDAFIGGHSGVSVSAGFGIAEGKRMSGDKHKTVAIAGDGSFTDGAIYEGLNNAGKSDANLLVILNDNEMSISKNTGAIAAYFSHLRSSRRYYKAKVNVKSFLDKNRVGSAVKDAVSSTKKFVKNAVYYQNSHGNIFENLGFKYYGIVDGHNLNELIEVLELVKMIDSPCLVHVKTKKGKGYKPAELNSGEYHGVDSSTGKSGEGLLPRNESYSQVFGKAIAELGANDERIVLISAAMKYATGCNYFNKQFPDRFYDCGIAEGHAVTFAAAMSTQGRLPVFAVYSTFSQRAFDRLLHDVAIENQHIILAVDRAGVVGEDGETHQGVFDVAMMSMIPNFTIFSPATSDELRECLRKALYEVKGPVAVRYPRGAANNEQVCSDNRQLIVPQDFRLMKTGSGRLNITYGRLVGKLSRSRFDSDLLQLVKIKPLPLEAVEEAVKYSEIVFYEEGVERGGIGEAFLLELVRRGWKGSYDIKGVKRFVPCAGVETQLRNIIEG